MVLWELFIRGIRSKLIHREEVSVAFSRIGTSTRAGIFENLSDVWCKLLKWAVENVEGWPAGGMQHEPNTESGRFLVKVLENKAKGAHGSLMRFPCLPPRVTRHGCDFALVVVVVLGAGPVVAILAVLLENIRRNVFEGRLLHR